MADDGMVAIRSDLALLGASATQLGALMRAGDVTAREVVEAHIARIQAVNPTLNAVIYPLFEEARAAAQAADASHARGEAIGALHGVPITVKDHFRVAGTPTTFGLAWRRDARADRDGPLVAALRAAGAIILGKTNLSQAGLFHEADNPVYGMTRNPWGLDRTSGGSSGGEAAIIASGGVPLGLGSDIGGSIRVPAHFCGIAGLKPTTLRLTRADTPTEIFAADPSNPPRELFPFQPGPMARSVEDLHLAMTVLAAASAGAADTTETPRYPDALPSVSGLRFAIQLDSSAFPCAPAIRRAVLEAAEHLAAQGGIAVEFDPPPVDEAARLFLSVLAADGGAWVRIGLRGDVPDRRLAVFLQAARVPNPLRRPLSWWFSVVGQHSLASTIGAVRPLSGSEFERLERQVLAYREDYLGAMHASGADIVLSPPHALPALRHGASEQLHVGNAAAVSVLYNVLGFPAGVVPVTRVREHEESERARSRDAAERAALETELGSAGLPVGVQIAAAPWREDLVLATMGEIEAAVEANGLPRLPMREPMGNA